MSTCSGCCALPEPHLPFLSSICFTCPIGHSDTSSFCWNKPLYCKLNEGSSKDPPCINSKLQSEVLVMLKAIELLPLAQLPILKNSLQLAQMVKVVQQGG